MKKANCKECVHLPICEWCAEFTEFTLADLPNGKCSEMFTGWISVRDRMPVPGERVLATDGGFVGEFYTSESGQWKRYNVNDYRLLMALDILWWMPLPEAP